MEDTKTETETGEALEGDVVEYPGIQPGALEANILALTPESDADRVVAARCALDAIKGWARARERELEAAMVEWIDRNGELTIGTTRYYVGRSTDTKCVDVRGTLERAFADVGGDFDALAGLLSANAFKPGACKRALSPETFALGFASAESRELKAGEPRKRGLQKTDTRFLK